MKVNLISNDIELQKSIEGLEYFSSVNITSEFQDDADVIVISDQIIPYNQLVALEDRIKNTSAKIFYMLSNSRDREIVENIRLICKTKEIEVIPPKLSLNQIRNKIVEILFPDFKTDTNVFTFFGADSKVGTTMVCHSVAEVLSKKTNLEVAVLFLSGNIGTNYIKDKNSLGLDSIKVKVMNNILSSNELKQSCIKQENLYLLPGVSELMDIRHYHPEHIDFLISLASKTFDIVLIDAGSNIDSGMAISALNSTKNKYLITTQQDNAKQNFDRLRTQIFKDYLQINTKDFLLIVNKYLQSTSIYNASQIADMYKMTLCSYIPNLEFLGWQAEYDKKTLNHYENEAYNKKILDVTKTIGARLNICLDGKQEKNESIFKKVFKNVGGLLS